VAGAELWATGPVNFGEAPVAFATVNRGLELAQSPNELVTQPRPRRQVNAVVHQDIQIFLIMPGDDHQLYAGRFEKNVRKNVHLLRFGETFLTGAE
jgi:hypothetical protein